MLLTPALVLMQVAIAVPSGAPSGASVAGTVRDGTAARPLAGVEVAEAGRPVTLTDSAGRYRLDGLSPGAHQLRFVLTGYDTLAVGVLLADSAVSHIDVQLVPLPVRLRTLEVVAASSPAPSRPAHEAELGRIRLDQEWLDRRQAGGGDPLRALSDAPGVEAGGEQTTALHVRGGAGGDNRVLLDGIPVFSAVHFGAATSAINPDAVALATLHPGVLAARFGDHLGGVIELETRDPGPDPLAGRGAMGLNDFRQGVSGYLPALRTGVSLSGRSTYRGPLTGEGYGGGEAVEGSGYRDFLGLASAQVMRGRLRLVSFLSRNRLAFPARGDGAGTASHSGDYPEATRNDVRWTSWSQGLTWNRAGTGVDLDAAVWAAGSSAEIAWGGAEGPEQLRSTLAEVGLSGRAAWPGTGTSAGASLIRSSARYAVTGAGGLTLDAVPVVASLFAERQWRPASALLLSTGLRASMDFRGWSALEPRIMAVLEPDPRTRLGLALGRSHQVVQSAANDASPLGLVLGLDLPAAAGAGGVPVAGSDQLEGFASRRVADGVDLTLSAWLRRSEGIVLGAASTRDFFPGDSIVIGRGEARGLTGTVGLSRGRVAARGSITVGRNVRMTPDTRYEAGYGNGGSLGLEASWAFLHDTRLQLRFRGGAHQPASAAEPGFEWQPGADAGELAGTPVNLPGAVNAERLPGYARLDLGVRRDWHFPGVGRGTVLTTALSLTNALDRTNALGLVARDDGGLRMIRGLPRTLQLEVGWRF